jgi:hypothetical protein
MTVLLPTIMLIVVRQRQNTRLSVADHDDTLFQRQDRHRVDSDDAGVVAAPFPYPFCHRDSLHFQYGSPELLFGWIDAAKMTSISLSFPFDSRVLCLCLCLCLCLSPSSSGSFISFGSTSCLLRIVSLTEVACANASISRSMNQRMNE